jgi:hypothetical protein
MYTYIDIDVISTCTNEFPWLRICLWACIRCWTLFRSFDLKQIERILEDEIYHLCKYKEVQQWYDWSKQINYVFLG